MEKFRGSVLAMAEGKPIFKFSKEKTFIKHGREIPKFYVRLRPQKKYTKMEYTITNVAINFEKIL
ncbi:MAG: hypothetical protein MJZ87_02175 [Bacteroidales bacterium]|nr:hypothetical protein [Bacteroidales bacterium]